MSRELNLVPRVYNQVKVEEKKKRGAVIAILVVVIIGALGVASTFGYEYYLNYKHDNLTKELQKNQELINKNNQLQQDIERTKAHIEKAKKLQVLKSQKTDVLFDELEKNFPTGIKAEKLNYNKASITMEGISSSKEAIQELWANLRESAIFNKSHITKINEDKGAFKFSLEIILVESKEEGGAQ